MTLTMRRRLYARRGSSLAPFVTPASVPQLAAGFWWDSELYTNLGASNFQWTEQTQGVPGEHFQVQTTLINQPTTVTENGFDQFEFGLSNPTIVRSPTDNKPSGWTGATWLAMWLQFPDGLTDVNTAFRMSGGSGQRRIIAQRSNIDWRLSLSSDGNGSFTWTWPSTPDDGWHFVEWIFRPTAAATLRGECWVDRAEQDRAAMPSYTATVIFDVLRAIYIGNAAGVANFDRARYGMIYYANGIPADSHIESLYRYKAPIVIP